MTEAARILKPEGILVMTDNNPKSAVIQRQPAPGALHAHEVHRAQQRVLPGGRRGAPRVRVRTLFSGADGPEAQDRAREQEEVSRRRGMGLSQAKHTIVKYSRSVARGGDSSSASSLVVLFHFVVALSSLTASPSPCTTNEVPACGTIFIALGNHPTKSALKPPPCLIVARMTLLIASSGRSGPG